MGFLNAWALLWRYTLILCAPFATCARSLLRSLEITLQALGRHLVVFTTCTLQPSTVFIAACAALLNILLSEPGFEPIISMAGLCGTRSGVGKPGLCCACCVEVGGREEGLVEGHVAGKGAARSGYGLAQEASWLDPLQCVL